MIIRELDVTVSGESVGSLSHSEDKGYVFTYHPDTPSGQFVSLTMPVRSASYDRGPWLHPIFDMNKPEGILSASLTTLYGKAIYMDSLGRLALTGQDPVGRIGFRADPALTLSPASASPEPVRTLIDDEPDIKRLYEALVSRYGIQSGISGVQPKVLASMLESEDHASVLTQQAIIKTSGEDYPYLALNEHLCLEAARQAGIPTPGNEILHKGEVLVVDRFDLDETGKALGFEEFSTLLGHGSSQKYHHQIEKVMAGAMQFVSPDRQREAATQLFRTVVLNALIKNGDAHTKNFGVLYQDTFDIKMAPAYDLVTTAAYLPEDTPAMHFAGKSVWPSRKALTLMGSQVFNLKKTEANAIIESVTASVSQSSQKIHQAMKDNPDFLAVGSRMLAQWDDGIRLLDARKERDKKALHTGIEVPDQVNRNEPVKKFKRTMR